MSPKTLRLRRTSVQTLRCGLVPIMVHTYPLGSRGHIIIIVVVNIVIITVTDIIIIVVVIVINIYNWYYKPQLGEPDAKNLNSLVRKTVQ